MHHLSNLATQAAPATAAAPAVNLAAARHADRTDGRVVIIALCGPAGAGKTSAAFHLRDHYGFHVAAFADSLKQMLEPLIVDAEGDYAALYEPHLKALPIPTLHGLSARQLMQRLGDWGRAISDHFWVNPLLARLGLALPGESATRRTPVHDRIVIHDLRYPAEAAALQRHGAHIVRIARHTAPAPVGPLHSSELHHAHLPATHTIDNSAATLADLCGQITLLMDAMGIDEREPLGM